jgi:hypothetical protein
MKHFSVTATVSHERGGDDNETQTDFGPSGAGFTYAYPGGGIRTLWSVKTPIKIRIVNSRDEIAELDPKERVVHLTFHLPAVALFELMKRCPRLKAIEVPPSRFAKLSKPSLCLLEGQGVKVFPGLVWGHRTDIDEYITVDEGSILQMAGELRAEGVDSGEIVAKVAEEAGVSPGMVEFVLDSGLRPSPLRRS